MTLPANIRVNVRAPFPAQVAGAAFVTVNKSNGIWTISPDYRLLANNPSITSTQILALQDSVTGLWNYVNANAFLTNVPSYRIITSAGATNLLPSDDVLLINPSPAGAVQIDLPLSATRNGAPVFIKDYARGANANNITMVPSGAETIDGLSGAAAAANGVAVIDTDGGVMTLNPLDSGGWYRMQ
jgi:hypothetical protein